MEAMNYRVQCLHLFFSRFSSSLSAKARIRVEDKNEFQQRHKDKRQ